MTSKEIEELAAGSYINEDYLLDLIVQNIKIGFVKMVLQQDACGAMDRLDELIDEGVVTQEGDLYKINWQLPYEAIGDTPDETLRSKCLDASEALDRLLRAKEILSRIKLKEAEA